jgi:molybdenum cofactor guanylyltransferase
MVDTPAYILAGGLSTRFGSDKARAMIDKQPQIIRLTNALTGHVKSVTVVARKADAYADLGLRTIADNCDSIGPVGGLRAALHDAKYESQKHESQSPWLLLLSCDLLAVSDASLQLLFSARQNDLHAVAFRHQYWEPLFALYHQAAAPVVDDMIRRGHYSLQYLLNQVSAQALPLPVAMQQHFQFNTPQEIKRETVD